MTAATAAGDARLAAERRARELRRRLALVSLRRPAGAR